MDTKIERIISFTPNLTNQEDAALRVADCVIKEIQSLFADDVYMVSEETGEVINIEELARVRGVIDAFYHTKKFTAYISED